MKNLVMPLPESWFLPKKRGDIIKGIFQNTNSMKSYIAEKNCNYLKKRNQEKLGNLEYILINRQLYTVLYNQN